MSEIDSVLAIRLSDIFRLVFDFPEDADVAKLRRIGNPKWDSLANVTLVTALESEFGVVMDSGDLERLTSFQGVLLLISEKMSK